MRIILKNCLYVILLNLWSCLSAAQNYVDIDLYTSFVLKGQEVSLKTYKAPTGFDPNVERYGGYILILDEAKIDGSHFWVGSFRDKKNGSGKVGLLNTHKGKVVKVLDSSGGFFADYRDINFAVLHDSGQHESFSTLYIIWYREDYGVDYRKLYVVNGTIAGAQVINNEFVISGVELDKPFARIVRLDGSMLFIDELTNASKH